MSETPDWDDLTQAITTTPGVTSLGLSSSDVTFYVFYYGCLGILALICVSGNSLVLIALFRHNSLRVSSNAFLISLAVADLLTGLVFVVYQVGHMEFDAIKDTLGK